MQGVIQAWKDAFNEQITNETFVDVAINALSTVGEKKGTGSIVAGSSSMLAISGSTFFGKPRNFPYDKRAFLERNGIDLDGTVLPFPDDDTTPLNWAGIIYPSVNMSGSDGSIATKPSIYWVLSSKQTLDVPYITIEFGCGTGAYATKFAVVLANGGTAIFSKAITNNKSSKCVVEITGLSASTQYNVIAITIVEWSDPYLRLKIGNIAPGIRVDLVKEDLMGFEIEQEFSPLNDILPHSKVQFKLDNLKWGWLFDNESVSEMFNEAETHTRLGIKLANGLIDGIDGGVFYLTEVEVSQDGLEVNFEGHNAVWFLSGINFYSKFNAFGSTSVKNEVNRVIEAVENLPDGVTWSIAWDDESGDIPNNNLLSLPPLVSTGESLNMLAQVCFSDIDIGRGKVISFKLKNATLQSYTVPQDWLLDYPKVDFRPKVKELEYTTTEWQPYGGPSDIVTDIDKSVTRYMLPRKLYLFTFPEQRYQPAAAPDITIVNGTPGHTVYVGRWVSAGLQLTISDDRGKASEPSEYEVKIEQKNVAVDYRREKILFELNDTGVRVSVENPVAWDKAFADALVEEPIKSYLVSNKNISFEFRADPRLDAGDVISVYRKEGGTYKVFVNEVKYSYNGGMFICTATGRII